MQLETFKFFRLFSFPMPSGNVLSIVLYDRSISTKVVQDSMLKHANAHSEFFISFAAMLGRNTKYFHYF